MALAQFPDQPNQKLRRPFEFDQRNVLITAMRNDHISRAKDHRLCTELLEVRRFRPK
jgi:hypothetical protein